MPKNKPEPKYFRARPDELKLLLLVLFTICLAFAMIAVHHQNQTVFKATDMIWFSTLIASALLSHLFLVILASSADQTLLPVLTMLVGFGMAFQYRLGSFVNIEMKSPIYWVSASIPLIAATVCLVFRKNRLEWLSGLTGLWVFIAIAIPAVVLFMGVQFRGGLYGPGRTTPTEFIKPLLLLALCSYLSRSGDVIDRQERLFSDASFRTHFAILLIWGIPAVLLIGLKDLGMIAVLTIFLIVLLTIATRRAIYAITGLFGSAAIGFCAKLFLHKGQVRFQAWIDPFSTPDTSGYQIIQSLFALFHGEFLGQGLGNGHPEKIPLASTDFIYSAIAEEIGFIGSILILLMYFYLVRRAIVHATTLKNTFSRLLVAGSGALILIQVFFNVGGVVKLIPMTGVPLPFISMGGSCAILNAFLIGVILTASESK
jgi:cell division protein FtsW (lipid II flippase)